MWSNFTGPHYMHTVHRWGLLLLLQRGLSVSLLDTTVSPTKTVEPIKVPFGGGLGYAKEPRIRLERGYPEGKVQFWGLLWPIVKNREYPVLASVSSWWQRCNLSLSLLYVTSSYCAWCHCQSTKARCVELVLYCRSVSHFSAWWDGWWRFRWHSSEAVDWYWRRHAAQAAI